MSLGRSEISARYPLPGYNFRVEVDETTMAFSEVSGISVEREVLTYRHGLSYWEGDAILTVRNDRYTPVTLRKGVVHKGRALYDWLMGGSEDRRSMAVRLCDADGSPVVTWHIRHAVAVKLDAPSFDPSDNGVAVETFEIMAAGISLEHH